jgi:hypothetical protein
MHPSPDTTVSGSDARRQDEQPDSFHRALPQSQAATDVMAERERQKDVEGWTAEHDDQHGDGAMAIAAACYALAADARALSVQTVNPRVLWQWTGWSDQWFKPKDERRNLVRAGALILAEIERLDRAAITKSGAAA